VVLLDPANPEQVTKTKNLYTEYPSVTLEEVAASNRWYATMVDPAKQPWFHENLLLTERYIEGALESSLASKCLEEYMVHEPAEQGGPLLFAIAMKHLQSNTTTSVDYLRKLITNMRIDNFAGEDVGHAVSLLRGAIARLENVRDPVTNQNQLPHDIKHTVVKVLQTTSVDDFNSFFKLVLTGAEIEQATKGISLTDALPSTAQLFTMATTTSLMTWSKVMCGLELTRKQKSQCSMQELEVQNEIQLR
jgi:hypothetical protein